MRGRDGKSFVRRTHESRIEGASDGASGTWSSWSQWVAALTWGLKGGNRDYMRLWKIGGRVSFPTSTICKAAPQPCIPRVAKTFRKRTGIQRVCSSLFIHASSTLEGKPMCPWPASWRSQHLVFKALAVQRLRGMEHDGTTQKCVSYHLLPQQGSAFTTHSPCSWSSTVPGERSCGSCWWWSTLRRVLARWAQPGENGISVLASLGLPMPIQQRMSCFSMFQPLVLFDSVCKGR